MKPLSDGIITPELFKNANEIGGNPLWPAPASDSVIPPYRKSFQRILAFLAHRRMLLVMPAMRYKPIQPWFSLIAQHRQFKQLCISI